VLLPAAKMPRFFIHPEVAEKSGLRSFRQMEIESARDVFISGKFIHLECLANK
jgi:hypothetical protein